MTINAMGGVLQQMTQQVQQINSGGLASQLVAGRDDTSASGFSEIFKNSLNGINTLQTEGKQQAANFMSGTGDVGLNDVMVSLQKSSVALNLGVQVRNKLVSAYQEIMNMAV